MFELVESVSAKVKVIGVGGAGGNAINALMRMNISGIECISANTDNAALSNSLSPQKIQLGVQLTKGLGAGADPEIGRKAALETRGILTESLTGADIIFISAGLGGGTGTGGGPVIAEIAKATGALVIGVVIMPFEHEGKIRNTQAQRGLAKMQEAVDTLLVIRNQRLLDGITERISILDAFHKIDDILYQTVKGLADLINMTGIINVDFADVKKTMSNKGISLIRTGTAKGQNRALDAVNNAINSEVFDENSIRGAKSILVNITGASDMDLREIDKTLSAIGEHSHPEASIIMGAAIDDSVGDEFMIVLIATDFEIATSNKANSTSRSRKVSLSPVGVGLFDREELSIPAFMRREEPKEFVNVIKLGMIDDGEYVNYDNIGETKEVAI